jgi:threonine aldolase
VADNHDIMLHIDGARAWNAAVASNMDIKNYLKDAHLISICMSKGMGCPVGSLIVGSEKNIYRAKILRKMLGGGMR